MNWLAGRKMPLWAGSSGAAFPYVFSEYARMWNGHTHERAWWVLAVMGLKAAHDGLGSVQAGLSRADLEKDNL